MEPTAGDTYMIAPQRDVPANPDLQGWEKLIQLNFIHVNNTYFNKQELFIASQYKLWWHMDIDRKILP